MPRSPLALAALLLVAAAPLVACAGARRARALPPPATRPPTAARPLAPPPAAATDTAPLPDAVPPLSARCGFDDAEGPLLLRWSGAVAPLHRRGPRESPRARLVADVRDASGSATEVLVDTGTSCAFVSMATPAARTATMSRQRLRLSANEGSTSFDGRDGVLPSLDLGGLAARDVPAFFLERPHDLRRPANIAGMAWLGSLAMAHEAAGDRWSLRQGGVAPVGTVAGTARLEAPGFPVVEVVSDAGERVYALVDTGAPTSLVKRGARPGRYRLLDASGATLLTMDARTVAPWTGLAPRGREVVVWIGLDDLARASFLLDFSTGVWTFLAGPPAAPAAR